MAASAQFTVTPSTPVQLAMGVKGVLIQNLGPYPLWIGAAGVTVGAGFSVPAGSPAVSVPLTLATLETVYAISESGDTDVRVLTTTGI